MVIPPLLGILFLMIAPALMICYIEGWKYMDALYFSVATMTTVGFGDCIAGEYKVYGPIFQVMIDTIHLNG